MTTAIFKPSPIQKLIYAAETLDLGKGVTKEERRYNRKRAYEPSGSVDDSALKDPAEDPNNFVWYECVNHRPVKKFSPRNKILSGELTRAYHPDKKTFIQKVHTCGSSFDSTSGLLEKDFEEWRIECFAAAQTLKRKQALTRLASLSCLLYHAAQSWGVFNWEVDEDRNRTFVGTNKDKAAEMIRSPFTLITALKATVGYINQRVVPEGGGYAPQPWLRAGASGRAVAIGQAIDWICETGCLEYDHTKFKAGTWGTTRCYTYFDVPRALILFEELEKSIGGFEAMPDNKAGLVKHLYDAIFYGYGYNRTGDPDTAPPEDWVTTEALRDEQKLKTTIAACRAITQEVEEERNPEREKVVMAFKSLVTRWRELRARLGAENPATEAARSLWHDFKMQHPNHLGWAI